MNEKLYNKNFLMIIMGQLISLFGNSVLRFSLPLFILDQTGSTAIFGTVLAVSSIPVILFSPIGGIMADRYNKKNIMVILDMITAVIITVCTLMLGSGDILILIAVMMVLLSIVQSLYAPVVQASLPFVSKESNLEKANGVVSFVSAISSLLGPVAAGILYGVFGIMPIMVIGAICFALASFMEIFIKIRFTPRTSSGSMVKTVTKDLKEGVGYITRENPILLKIIIVVSCINLSLTSMILVGLPTIIKIKLNLGSELYGITQGLIALGMIAGGILAYSVGNKIRVSRIYRVLILISISQIPVGLVFIINTSVMFSFWVISVSSAIMMMLVTLFSINMMSFVQRETPKTLIGKVISFILMMTKCTLPIGQALYGYLFKIAIGDISIIIFATLLCSSLISLYSRKIFQKFDKSENAEYNSIELNNQPETVVL